MLNPHTTEITNMKFFIAYLIIVASIGLSLLAITGCDDTKDQAQATFKRETGRTGRCVKEEGSNSSVAFCTDGRVLSICTDDEGCLTVNITLEAPAAP